MAKSWRVYGLGIIVMALVSFGSRDFSQAQPVPPNIPGRTALAFAANAFMLVAGVAIEWPRFTSRAALALALYYGLIVVVLMHGDVIVAHPAAFVAYSSTAMQLAIAAAATIIYCASAPIDSSLALRITLIGQRTFGVCALFFGAAHFVYLNLTAPVVPAWLPPSQIFWAYFTGIAHIAGGIAILIRLHARLAAILLSIMYASFTPLVLIPLVLSDPHNHFFWTENAVNIILVGAAWIVADSLRPRSELRSSSRDEVDAEKSSHPSPFDPAWEHRMEG